ncbi:MAG: hypothetical protein ABI614_09585 [Planctomycetota bacterium]
MSRPKANPPATDAKQLASIQPPEIFLKHPLSAVTGKRGLTQRSRNLVALSLRDDMCREHGDSFTKRAVFQTLVEMFEAEAEEWIEKVGGTA